jgi:hypothetical protein
VMILEFGEVIGVLQEETFNELSNGIRWIVDDVLGFGHDYCLTSLLTERIFNYRYLVMVINTLK